MGANEKTKVKGYVSQAEVMQSIEERMKELGELGPCMGGSLCQRSGKCTNPECGCHKGERKHLSWQLTQVEHGKTHTVYIPAEMVEQVRVWTENHRRAKALMKEVSGLCETYIRAVVPRQRAGLTLEMAYGSAAEDTAEEGQGGEEGAGHR